ncbi:helix-turn-helix domain-containing protein [Bacillus massiliglaciei]|uniref:helix-turn-helix domain-containing protein n=1 Tax=Bacillus massiliglaciei TaxID=1816693 RepID=UPI000AD4BE63|nr:helix-turn-helix domain-containing protein [Bacillus massiliglaciei]
MINLLKKQPNLYNRNILGSAEACKEWGIEASTLRRRIKDFPEGTIRKFGSSWVVTKEGMYAVFGEKRINSHFYNR